MNEIEYVVCPQCKLNTLKPLNTGENGVSRVDNITEICSDCETQEALVESDTQRHIESLKDAIRIQTTFYEIYEEAFNKDKNAINKDILEKKPLIPENYQALAVAACIAKESFLDACERLSVLFKAAKNRGFTIEINLRSIKQ